MRALQLVGQVLQLPVVRDAGLAKLHQKTAQALQATGSTQTADASYAASSLTHFLTQAGKLFGKDPTKWEAVGQGKVCVNTLEHNNTIIFCMCVANSMAFESASCLHMLAAQFTAALLVMQCLLLLCCCHAPIQQYAHQC